MAVVSLSQAYVRYVDGCAAVSGNATPILGFSQWLGLSVGDLVGNPSLVRGVDDVLGVLQGVVSARFGCTSAGRGESGVYNGVTLLEDFPKCSTDRDGESEWLGSGKQLVSAIGGIAEEKGVSDDAVSAFSVPNGKKASRKRKNRKRKAIQKDDTAVNQVDERGASDFSAGVFSAVERRVGAFDSCDEVVRKELQESRATMLIAENKVKTAKAESLARHLELVRSSRVNETKFELDRQTVEEKLHRLSVRRLGLVDTRGMPTGNVETVVTDTGLGSYATPSLTSGSVSPDSSISMREVGEMKSLIEKLSLENRQLRSKLDSDVKPVVQSDCGDYYDDDSLDRYAIGVDVQHRRAALAEQRKIMADLTVPRVENAAVVLDLKPGVVALPGESIDDMVKRIMKERGFENMMVYD